MKKLLTIALFSLFLFVPLLGRAEEKITVYFFESETCPHCAAEKIFLEKLQQEMPQIEVKEYEVTKNARNLKLLQTIGQKFSIDASRVPITIIGDQYIPGYETDETSGAAIRDIINEYHASPYKDVVAPLIPQEIPPANNNNGISQKIPESVKIPFFGEINIKKMSLPALTALFGILDGFNPCSMWALIFLIGLLISMGDKKRLILLGSLFVATSALSYFLFMAAWLNLFLFLGFLFWVRIVIGGIALGSGVYNIREFFVNKKAVCKVSTSKQTRKFTQRLRDSINHKNIILAVLGIIALAFSVNLIELVCSAGFPAIYTQVLALNHLPTWQYYAYLVAYVFFYDLDELIVLAIAIFSFKITATSNKFTRWSQIIGGILMLILGALLIFKPAWLMFG